MISSVALTFESTIQVHANLTACIWVLTLINIFTFGIINQSEPRSTETFITDLQISTDVRTASIFFQAFIITTLLHGLIGPVSAITPLVTHFVQEDTLPTPTFELVGTFTPGHIDTPNFIAVVMAVKLFVALKASMNARPVFTLKFIRVASCHSTALLVRFIPAVCGAVAAPFHVDALATGGTMEFEGSAGIGTFKCCWTSAAL